jgi:hypothetical protein
MYLGQFDKLARRNVAMLMARADQPKEKMRDDVGLKVARREVRLLARPPPFFGRPQGLRKLLYLGKVAVSARPTDGVGI